METQHFEQTASRTAWQRWVATLLLLCVTSLLEGCRDQAATNGPPADGKTPVRIVLNWLPESQHGGYYAALVHGYFDEAGLDVTIVPGGPGSPVVQEVVTDRAQFGVINADQIYLAREQQADVVALMAPLQHSPRCIMVHAESGIESFSDLHDITLAINDAKPYAMFLRKQYAFENVQFVPYSGGVAEFLLKPKFAQQAYVFSEPFAAQQNDAEVRSLMVSDTGFDPYSTLLFTTGQTTNESSELTSKVVQACIRGWQQYLDDPTQSNAHIKSINSEMTDKVLAFGVQAMQPLCQPDEDESVGTMTAERWKQLHAQMVDLELISADKVRAEDAFDLSFVKGQ